MRRRAHLLVAGLSLNIGRAPFAATAAGQPAQTAWPLRVLTVWLVMVVLLLLIYAPAIATVRFGDPDDALRLVQVRDLLGGQGWFDLHQYRINAPAGVPMHWSRLVDIPLAATILALRPLLGPALAEMIALVWVPLLTLLATLMLVGRLAAKFFDTETVGVACLLTGIAGPLLFQMTPLRIDHHGWQVVLALAALNGLAARDVVRGGLVIGAALAAQLTISIEGLPITAAFLGVLALRGLTDRGSFAGLAAASVTLALGSLGLFVTTRGLGDLTTHCDQVSPLHIALFALVAAGTGTLAMLAPRRLPLALGMLGGTGAAVLALFLGVAPQCRGGAFVALDPLVLHYWYDGIPEGMPFWHLPLVGAIDTIAVPLIGLFAIVLLWRAAPPGRQRTWWRDYALMLAGAMLIGATLARASATACAFAAIPTAWLVLQLIVTLRTASPLRRVAGYMVLLVVLMPPFPVVAWTRVSMMVAGNDAHASAIPAKTDCSYAIAAQALNARPVDTLFLPVDMGPDFLVRTHDNVVATGHHRGAAGIHDVMTAFFGSPDQARAIVRRHHATLVVICPDLAEPQNYEHYAPNGFMAQLRHGKTPAWLEPVDLAPGSHMRFWRVKAPN
jgi:hypothetical protein